MLIFVLFQISCIKNYCQIYELSICSIVRHDCCPILFMCYRPLHLMNNSRHYDPHAMPMYFSCPCGKCEDCKRSKQSEWFVRAFYEWQYVRSKGGCGFFYTLTYNDDHLPRYNGIPCFSKEDIQLFIKRLKERLMREYGVELTYLIASENGELLQRPHYHADFFVSKTLMPWSFFKCVDECWQKGFVYAGQNGGIINSPSGILYVTKYITKDSSFASRDKEIYAALKDDYARAYEQWVTFADSSLNAPDTFDDLIKLRSAYINVPEVIVFYNSFRRHYMSISCFKTSSIKFGYFALEPCNKDKIDDVHDKILVPSGKKYTFMSLPRYFMRKLYFDRVPNEKDGKKNRFVLNLKGKQHFIDTIDTKVDELELEYKNFFRSTRLTDFQFQSLETHFSFRGNKDFRIFLDNLDIDFRKLAIYSLVYRNRFKIAKRYDYFVEYKDYIRDLFSLVEDRSYSSLLSLSSKEVNYINNNLFNFNPDFFIYEQVYLLYSQMVCIIHTERAFKRIEERKKEREIREIINLSNLKFAV